MNLEIKFDAERRGIRRLCHFTSSANFLHVLQSGLLKDRATLDREENKVVNPTDELRLDGHREAICCSVEYPNSYYLDTAAKKELIFEGWIILLLNPELLWKPGTLFCQKNAAAANGSLIREGLQGYLSMYPQSARGFSRKATHLPAVPTDLQAEVLVPGPIPFTAVTGIVMKSNEQAETELARWDTLSIPRPQIPILISPDFFNKTNLRDRIWRGEQPLEVAYDR